MFCGWAGIVDGNLWAPPSDSSAIGRIGEEPLAAALLSGKIALVDSVDVPPQVGGIRYSDFAAEG